jgi:hypothetical protein
MKADSSFRDVEDDTSIVVFEVHIGNSCQGYTRRVPAFWAGNCCCHYLTSSVSMCNSRMQVLLALKLANEVKLTESTVTAEKAGVVGIENQRLGGDEAMKFFSCASGETKLNHFDW